MPGWNGVFSFCVKEPYLVLLVSTWYMVFVGRGELERDPPIRHIPLLAGGAPGRYC